MSLRVWLPLNGDLHNQGLSDVTVTNNGATINNSGKIGKCYSIPSVTDLSYSGNNLNTTSISLCCWVRFNTTNISDIINSQSYTSTYKASNGNILGNNSYGGFSLQWYTNDIYTDGSFSSINVQCYLRTSTVGAKATTSINLPLDTWNHLCVICDRITNQCSLYLNGIIQKFFTFNTFTDATDRTFKLNYPATAGGNYRCPIIPILYNDVRIYDHALSELEIKEIARAKVLHYPLNNKGLGRENLALNTRTLTPASAKTNLNMSTRGAATRQLRSDGFYESKCTASWQGLSFWENQLNLTVGTKITYSFYIYGNGSSRSFSFYPMMFNSAGTRDTSTKLPISLDGGAFTTVNAKAFTPTTTTVPERHYATFEWNQAVADIITNGGSIELSIQVHGTWNSGDWVCLFAPKIEIGESPTCWSPNPTELGLDTNIEYDISGYCNNGTKVGTFTYSTDTPKYGVSTHIGFTTSKIHISNFYTSGFGDSYTFTWWGKRNSNNPMFWGFSDGIRLNGMYIGKLWNTGDGSNNPLYEIGTITQVTPPSVNVWHHYAMTGNGTKCYVYLDGELWAEAKTYKSISGTSIYINGWDANTNYCSNNTDISDFRIYATALSAQDVLDLYNNSTLSVSS